ncbi:MAG: copper homeostasis protein CutC [Culicoidibacterales bacterium]
MFLEVIALDENDVQEAQFAGASRIELVSQMEEDGLTPQISILEKALSVTTIPLRVMVRFHNNNFVNTPAQSNQIAAWIQSVDHLPINGYVIGALTDNGTIDCQFLDKIITQTTKPLTFHRAFDRCNDRQLALETLNKYEQIDCILTSGGVEQPITENIQTLKTLQKQTTKKILVGGGVTYTSATTLLEAGLDSIHIGSLGRKQQKMDQPIDTEMIAKLIIM